MKTTYLVVCALLLAVVLAVPTVSWAHCDSVAGPVATDVKLALQSGNVSPVLKWIRAADEPELRAVFNRAISVRRSGAEAASLADQFFLETAIRLHRASEGEPYTGVKPASAVDEPVPVMVDAALRANSFDALTDSVASAMKTEVDKRIEALKRARAHADDSPALGREYVRSYVELVHYLEHLQSLARSNDSTDGQPHAEH
jgi:hypothetical protein